MDWSTTHVIRSVDDPSLFVGRVRVHGPLELLSFRWAWTFDSDDAGETTAANVAEGLTDKFGELEVVLTDLHGNEVANA